MGVAAAFQSTAIKYAGETGKSLPAQALVGHLSKSCKLLFPFSEIFTPGRLIDAHL